MIECLIRSRSTHNERRREEEKKRRREEEKKRGREEEKEREGEEANRVLELVGDLCDGGLEGFHVRHHVTSGHVDHRGELAEDVGKLTEGHKLLKRLLQRSRELQETEGVSCWGRVKDDDREIE